MVVSRDELPGSTPGPGLEVEEAQIVQYAVLITTHAAANKQLVIVNNSRVSRAASGYGSMGFGLCPVRRLDVEDDNIREMYAVFVLASVNKQFVALPQTRCVTHAQAGNVSIVVDQTPLARIQIEFEHVVVYFVGVLIEATEGVDAVVADIGDRGVDQAGRALADGGDDFGHVRLGGVTSAAFHRRT